MFPWCVLSVDLVQEGETALSLEAKNGDIEAMQMLLKAGADPNTRNKVSALGVPTAAGEGVPSLYA